MKKLIDPGPSEAGWHRIQSITRCLRYYALNCEQVARPQTDALVNGSLVHVGLAHWYARRKARLDGTDPDAYYEPHEAIARLAMNKASEPDLAEVDRRLWLSHVEMAKHMVHLHSQHYDAETFHPLHVEEQIRGHVRGEEGERYLYTQRADLIAKDSAGMVWIIDHKTTFRIAPKTIKRYTLSGQFLGYQLLGKKLFADRFGGVLLNMLQRPLLKQYNDNQQLSIDLKRVTLEPAPFAVKTLKQTILAAERQIKQYNHLDDAMDWPGAYHETACTTPYGTCPFHETCQFGF